MCDLVRFCKIWSHIYLLYSPGINVSYSAEVLGAQSGDALLRCLLLLWTGDYPAQSEVGKFVNGSIHPCRRCELQGTTDSVMRSKSKHLESNPIILAAKLCKPMVVYMQ